MCPRRYPKKVPFTNFCPLLRVLVTRLARPDGKGTCHWVLPRAVKRDRSLVTATMAGFFFLEAEAAAVTEPAASSFSSSPLLVREEELKANGKDSSCCCAWFVQWRVLWEEEKEESSGVLTMIVFILEWGREGGAIQGGWGLRERERRDSFSSFVRVPVWGSCIPAASSSDYVCLSAPDFNLLVLYTWGF